MKTLVERQTLKRSLLGISPSNASSYIRQHRKLQEEERSELEMTVLHLQEENAKLLAELTELTARQRERAGREQYQDLIRLRGEAALRVLYEHTQEELAGLQDLIDQKHLEHQQKMNRIEEQTDYYKQTLQNMLQEFGATMQKFNSSNLDQWDENELTAFAERVAEPQEESTFAKRQPRKFLSHRKRSVVLRTSIFSQADAEASARIVNTTGETCDTREYLETSKSAVAVPGTKQIATPTASQAVKPVARPMTKPTRIVQEQPSEFWGSIQSFVDGEAVDFENEWELEASASVELSPYEEKPWMTEMSISQQEQAVSAPVSQAADAPIAEGDATKASEVVSKEIMSIRNRYIVGKVAGEDLLDSVGRLIVAKHETITGKVVEIAEREGKLSDLIVNMKIPGVSVDPS